LPSLEKTSGKSRKKKKFDGCVVRWRVLAQELIVRNTKENSTSSLLKSSKHDPRRSRKLSDRSLSLEKEHLHKSLGRKKRRKIWRSCCQATKNPNRLGFFVRNPQSHHSASHLSLFFWKTKGALGGSLQEVPVGSRFYCPGGSGSHGLCSVLSGSFSFRVPGLGGLGPLPAQCSPFIFIHIFLSLFFIILMLGTKTLPSVTFLVFENLFNLGFHLFYQISAKKNLGLGAHLS